jgi:hypothetical protein
MSLTWLVWPIGGALIVAAGFAVVVVPRFRARERERLVAWSAARAAIESAAISRDAARGEVAEAERLLARAEALVADRGGTDAARTAVDCAERADALWRAADE